ncbi:MAG: Gldg family protein, partial [Verrucomicrobia bacterium]|nr:Gldg family protein [Verrucomicrobiota bacterium]
DEPLYHHVVDLLKEYSLLNLRVQVEVVNYVTEPDKASLVKNTYKLSPAAKDLVIFECNGRWETVPENMLSELDPTKLIRGESQVVKRKAFLGERFFTSKILAVSDAKPPKAYFLFGHSEYDPTAGSSPDLSYSRFGEVLRDSSVQIAPLVLMGTNDVPADCNLLVIAGPQAAFDPTEVKQLEKYLDRGGRVFLLLDYRSTGGLGPTLAKWGVHVSTNVVLDPQFHYTDFDVAVGNFGSHAIVKPLSQIQTKGLRLALPRPVGARAGGRQATDAPQVTELAFTSPAALAYANFRPGAENKPDGPPRAFPLMVAVERGAVPGTSLPSMRMVVTGDSQFLANNMIGDLFNREFAWHAVNWLLDRSALLNIGPRPFKEYELNMTRAQVKSVRLILMAGVPGAVMMLGLAVWLRRRH